MIKQIAFVIIALLLGIVGVSTMASANTDVPNVNYINQGCEHKAAQDPYSLPLPERSYNVPHMANSATKLAYIETDAYKTASLSELGRMGIGL